TGASPPTITPATSTETERRREAAPCPDIQALLLSLPSARPGVRRQRARVRVPGAAQHEVVRCRPGTPVCSPRNRGPASAVHRYALHRVRDTRHHAATQCAHTPVISITRALGVKPTARPAACRVPATDAEAAS